MEEFKICVRCKRNIEDGEKAVLLKTFKGEKTIADEYFHFDCYVNWFKERGAEIAKNTLFKAKKQAVQTAQGLLNPITEKLQEITDDEKRDKIYEVGTC